MPPDTLWTGNPTLKVTTSEGNIACDDASVLSDSSTTFVDGAPQVNLTSIYTPSQTLWTEEEV